MKKIFFSLLITTFIFSSCIDNKNAQLIIGHWQGALWLQDGQTSSHNADMTSFSFDKDGHYTYSYEENTEKGSYKIENDMLFTHPEGQQEIMVKIAKLTADTLIFDMSRGGTPESLTLIKVK